MKCKRCDLPDHACECEPIITTAHSRYHVTHPEEGVIEWATSKDSAVSIMLAWLHHRLNDWPNKLAVTVFDSMARHRQADLWGWFEGVWRVLSSRV